MSIIIVRTIDDLIYREDRHESCGRTSGEIVHLDFSICEAKCESKRNSF